VLRRHPPAIAPTSEQALTARAAVDY